ncbi:hypothetical protein Tco_0176425, partial [Tanacetum coccineum]
KYHNSIMKDKMVYKGNNVIRSLMNVPIFVGTFSIVTDFAVLENIDAYRDDGMGDVIFGELISTDISKITRKPSKTGKHGHGKWKSTREDKDSKPKLKKVNFQSTLGQQKSTTK